MAELRYDNLIQTLEGYGKDVAERYSAKLSAAGKDATGTLSRTIRSFVLTHDDAIAVYLELQHYWEYLERGTRMQGPWKKQGRRPPLAPFVSWVRAKGIPLRGKKIEAVAWAVATKVWKEGTRPYWFLRDTLAEFPDINERAAEAVKKDIEIYIQEIIQEARL